MHNTQCVTLKYHKLKAWTTEIYPDPATIPRVSTWILWCFGNSRNDTDEQACPMTRLRYQWIRDIELPPDVFAKRLVDLPHILQHHLH